MQNILGGECFPKKLNWPGRTLLTPAHGSAQSCKAHHSTQRAVRLNPARHTAHPSEQLGSILQGPLLTPRIVCLPHRLGNHQVLPRHANCFEYDRPVTLQLDRTTDNIFHRH